MRNSRGGLVGLGTYFIISSWKVIGSNPSVAVVFSFSLNLHTGGFESRDWQPGECLPNR